MKCWSGTTGRRVNVCVRPAMCVWYYVIFVVWKANCSRLDALNYDRNWLLWCGISRNEYSEHWSMAQKPIEVLWLLCIYDLITWHLICIYIVDLQFLSSDNAMSRLNYDDCNFLAISTPIDKKTRLFIHCGFCAMNLWARIGVGYLMFCDRSRYHRKISTQQRFDWPVLTNLK